MQANKRSKIKDNFIISFLIVIFAAMSLGFGLSLRAGGASGETPSTKSTEAATWPDSPPWPLEFVQMAQGPIASHTLGITKDGELYSFGYNYYGQLGNGTSGSGANQSSPQLIMSGTKFTSIAAGTYHSLAITDTGALYSFGRNNYGQLGTGDTTSYSTPQLIMSGTSFKSVAAGYYYSLAITESGALYSWGDSYYGQLGNGTSGGGANQSSPQLIMSSITFSSIAAGCFHSLIITTTGALYSFGQNNYGQLGTGNTTNYSTPQLIMSGTSFKSVAASESHSLAITNTGALYSFGHNEYGQLGNGTTSGINANPSPQLVMSSTKFTSIAAGNYHSLIITESGALYAFGNNGSGQLGTGNTTQQSTPQLVMTGTSFKSVAAGASHSLIITTTGALYSFGSNYYGQLGLGDAAGTGNQTTPQLVAVRWGTLTPPWPLGFVQMAQGPNAYHSLGITKDGSLYSWGMNDFGQLGIGTVTEFESTPQLVMSGTKFTQVEAGYSHSLAITISGNLYSWGNNGSGQLGTGIDDYYSGHSTPQPVMSGTKFLSITAGFKHSLAITESGDLYSFGSNYYGQLGITTNSETETPNPNPQLIMGGTTFVSIAAGQYHSLATTTTGELYSFGLNDYGQLGLGTTTGENPNPTPSPVMGGTKFSSVAAGSSHSFAITDTGALYSFGRNDFNQLGIRIFPNHYLSTPQLIMSGTSFKSVAAGYGHSLAITDTGALYSFGHNNFGQLGSGNTNQFTTPQLIMSGTSFKSVAAGIFHSLAITDTGDLYSCGLNDYGQLGNSTTTGDNPNSTPQLVAKSPSSNIAIGFIGGAGGRFSVDGQAFIPASTLNVDNGGELSVIFQSTTNITQIVITISSNTTILTLFNDTQTMDGISFILASSDPKIVSVEITNITSDITITASSENTWQVECIDEYSGSTFVTVGGSYILPTPAVPQGKTFAGWFNDKGEQVTAATEFSNIANWGSVERITRVYAKWI